MKKLFLLALVVIGLCYCTKDKSVMPDNTPTSKAPITQELCDTTPASFSADINPIIQASCATPGCHNTTGAAGIKLTNYSEIKSQAELNRFLSAIKHKSGFSNMPKSASKLADSNITKIECWINNGLLDD
jgi:cytochrome c553